MNNGQRLLKLWYWTALIVSVIFVLAIPVSWYFPDFVPGIVGRMNLGNENNLGAWWSGVLLFMLACHSYDAGAAEYDRAPRIARAWMIIAAILLFLSADEIGSLHERLMIFGSFLGVSGWAMLLPLGGIIGVYLLLALYTFWQSDDGSRQYVLPLFVGFGILGSVAIQEFIELAVDWGSGAGVWIRLAVEEGSELLGMIILLRVTLRPCMKIAGNYEISNRRLFTALSDHARKIFFVLFALIPIFTIMMILVTDHRGRLADWLSIISFVTAGLFAFSRVMSGETTMVGRYTALAALCLAASIAPMYFPPTAVWSISDFVVNKQIPVSTIIYLLICGSWLVIMQTRSRNLKMLMALFIVFTVAVPILGSNETIVVLVTQVLAVLTLGITYIVIKDPEPRQ
jgi:hypothetical protein